MKKDWYKLYINDIEHNGGILSYYQHKNKNRKKLIREIEKCISNGKLVEAGCGSGVLSVKLCELGYDVIAIDNDKRMLKIVEEIKNKISNNQISLIKQDIFSIDKILEKENIDVIFSVGVFEHFSDDEIIELLMKQLSISKYVFLAIPTKYFNDNEALYGNERFLPYKKWRDLIKSSNGKIIKEFSCQNQNIIERIKNVRKYFRPAPIRVFVIKGD